MRSRAPWVYLHLPLVLGLMGFGSAQHHLILQGDADLDGPTRALMAITVAMTLISMALLQTTLGGDLGLRRRLTIAMLCGAVVTLLAGLALPLSGAGFMWVVGAAALPAVAVSCRGQRDERSGA